jgi:hypothetical protein
MSRRCRGDGGRRRRETSRIMSSTVTDIDFRQATPDDFDYCARLDVAAMEVTIRELDVAKHTAGFRERWSAAETRIITRDGADIGWLQASACR